MNRQKMLLSTIAAVILIVAYPSLSTAQDQVQQGLTVEIVPADNECVGGYGLKESSLECVYEQVSSLANWLSGWINEDQKFNLEVLKVNYPFYGVGIHYRYVSTEKNSDERVLRVTIMEVWKGSPADKTGLQPDDVIVNVSGWEVPEFVVPGDKQISTTDALHVRDLEVAIKEAVANAKDPFTMAVERDGQVIDIELAKTTLGQEIADVLRNNLAEIERRNMAVRDMAEELVRQVEVHKDDKEMLLNLYDQFSDLNSYQDEPFLAILFVEADKWQR